MKERVTFSIDKQLMETVRNNIPNMSNFIEDCFKAYLSFAIENEEERGEELRQAWEDFNRAKLSIHLLTKVDYAEQDIDNAIQRQKNNAWLNVWSDYRRIGSTHDYKIEKASKTLNLETEVLKQLLEDTLAKSEEDKKQLYIFDNWNYVSENILPNVTVDNEEFDLDDLLNGKVDLD